MRGCKRPAIRLNRFAVLVGIGLQLAVHRRQSLAVGLVQTSIPSRSIVPPAGHQSQASCRVKIVGIENRREDDKN